MSRIKESICFCLFCLCLCAGFRPMPLLAAIADGVTVNWRNGFRIEDKRDNNLYYLRLRFAFQLRYTYLRFDESIVDNSIDNWSNFYLRRCRLFADGYAPSRHWKYLLHLQMEPSSTVNLNDAYVQWQRFDWCRFQFGRMKIPYGLEFWQSGFAQNGVERTIFSGETGVDGKARDVFWNGIDRFWPGGNEIFPVSGHQIDGTLFPSGGLLLYRSQGINVNGEVPVPGLNLKSTLLYWIGVFNGRETKGFANPTSSMLYSLRLGYAPLGKWPLTVQGDPLNITQPKFVLLLSCCTYTDKASMQYDSTTGEFVDSASYQVRDYGYNLAGLFRYRGGSVDLEYGFENFDMMGNTAATSGNYDRLGGRVNLGYFLVPTKCEAVFKWAYVERIHNNSQSASLYTGLGLVTTTTGDAVERNLQEFTWGINFYLHANNQKICLDYSYLLRHLTSVAAGLSVKDQHDHRMRLMYQQVF